MIEFLRRKILVINRFSLILTSILFLISAEYAKAQSRFIPVENEANNFGNLYIDSEDILIQDHLDPSIRVARVIVLNNFGKLSNVIATVVNCEHNSSGVMMIANSQGEIVYIERDKVQLTKQHHSTQEYKQIRLICSLPAQSGNI